MRSVSARNLDDEIGELQRQLDELQATLEQLIENQRARRQAALQRLAQAVKTTVERGIRIQRELLEELRPEIHKAGEDAEAIDRLTEKFVEELRARLADPDR